MSWSYDLGVIVSLLALLTPNFISATASDGTKNHVASIQMNRMGVLRGQTTASVVESHSGTLCTAEMKAYSAALENRETWARQMWDASTKMPSGILQGNYIDLGMYQQCISVDGSHNNVTVKGRYCMVVFSYDSGKLALSVCLPSACNEKHALKTGNSSILLSLANSSLGIELQAVSASCAPIGAEEFWIGEILVITLFLSIGAFMLLCTICDFVERAGWSAKESSAVVLRKLVKFSLYTNTLALFDTRTEPGTIPALNGIRFLSTCWIVAFHQRHIITYMPLVNASQYSQWAGSWSALWFHTSEFATDNFFLIGGFLLTYFFFKKMRSGGKLDLLSMYFHRYVRLTPGITVVGLWVGVLFHRMGSGPTWGLTIPGRVASCKKRWWMNLLYIQNFLTEQDICVIQSWYLAADMQLFVLSPMVLYPLHRWPKFGLGILGVLLLSSIVAPALVIGLNEIPMEGTPESFAFYHVRFYTRAFPYLAGMLLAYYVVTKKRRLSKVTVILGWIGSCVVIILCCLAIRRLNVAEYNLAYVTACAALLRQSWSIAMAWIIYTIIHGHGGVLARFLSMPIFLPLSRISFGIYLTHGHAMLLRYGTTTIPGILEERYMFEDFMASLLLSMALAALLHLFVEKPVMIADNIFKTRRSNEKLLEVALNVNEEARSETCNGISWRSGDAEKIGRKQTLAPAVQSVKMGARLQGKSPLSLSIAEIEGED